MNHIAICVAYIRDSEESHFKSNICQEWFQNCIKFIKFVLSKGRMYVGKWYLYNDLLKANVTIIDVNSKFLYLKANNKEKPLVYIVVSPYLWHNRLRHVNYGTMKKLVNLWPNSKVWVGSLLQVQDLCWA